MNAKVNATKGYIERGLLVMETLPGCETAVVLANVVALDRMAETAHHGPRVLIHDGTESPFTFYCRSEEHAGDVMAALCEEIQAQTRRTPREHLMGGMLPVSEPRAELGPEQQHHHEDEQEREDEGFYAMLGRLKRARQKRHIMRVLGGVRCRVWYDCSMDQGPPTWERVFVQLLDPERPEVELTIEGFKAWLADTSMPPEAFVLRQTGGGVVDGRRGAWDKPRCPHDGAICHHDCSRQGGCFRLTSGMELSEPCEGFPVIGNRPVLSEAHRAERRAVWDEREDAQARYESVTVTGSGRDVRDLERIATEDPMSTVPEEERLAACGECVETAETIRTGPSGEEGEVVEPGPAPQDPAMWTAWLYCDECGWRDTEWATKQHMQDRCADCGRGTMVQYPPSGPQTEGERAKFALRTYTVGVAGRPNTVTTED